MTRRKAFSPDEYISVLERQDCLCAMCGEPLPVRHHMDHAVPLWLGGADSIENIQALHVECHRKKTAREARARAKIQREHARQNARQEPDLNDLIRDHINAPPANLRPRTRMRNPKYKKKVNGSVIIRPEWRG